MIFDIIDRKIKDMKELRRLELIKANQAQQDATDTTYHKLVYQVKTFSLAIAYAYDNLSFITTDTLRSGIVLLLENLKNVIGNGYADKEAVSKAENDFKVIQNATKKEWAKHFTNYTLTTTNTLRVISGIDSEKINGCLSDIKAAEPWTVDLSILDSLKKAIENADTLITSLNMDQEIVLFLTKMTSGKATVADLNEKVLIWIKQEGVESKIKLSFLSR